MTISRRVFINRAAVGTASLVFARSLANAFQYKDIPAAGLPRSTPELQGMSSSGIISFLDAIEQSGIQFHSLMIVRNGNVVTEGWWAPYSAPLKHTLYSLSKSFTSSAVGFAITEKKFSLESPVVSFFPADVPASVSENLKAMQVKHLLCMGTGHDKDTMAPIREAQDSLSWVARFLNQPVVHAPGTHFLYNTGATYMLSAIVQKVTGQPVLEYLKPRLFEPLAINGMDWETNVEGINVGGYGLRVRTEDIAKFGLLYLQKGKWNGKQILPTAWVDDALTAHIDNSNVRPRGKHPEDDWAQGYGYQFWRCTHNAVRGDGAFGQFCVMLPEQNAVVAITGESFDLQGSMNLVWNNLLPAFGNKSQANSNTATALQNRLTKLAITLPKANSSSPIASRISGKKYTLKPNDFTSQTVTFQFNPDHVLLTLTDDKGELSVKCGINSWMVENDFMTQRLFPMKNRPVVPTPLAASATWVDDDSLVVTLQYTATAHGDQLTFNFEANNLVMRLLNSVANGNPNTPETRGVITGSLT